MLFRYVTQSVFFFSASTNSRWLPPFFVVALNIYLYRTLHISILIFFPSPYAPHTRYPCPSAVAFAPLLSLVNFYIYKILCTSCAFTHIFFIMRIFLYEKNFIFKCHVNFRNNNFLVGDVVGKNQKDSFLLFLFLVYYYNKNSAHLFVICGFNQIYYLLYRVRSLLVCLCCAV